VVSKLKRRSDGQGEVVSKLLERQGQMASRKWSVVKLLEREGQTARGSGE